MVRLDAKRAIVTGAGRGIGTAIAAKFPREGARLLACDIVGDRIAATAREVAPLGPIEAMTCDVTEPDAGAALVRRARDRFGGLDILANNAGISIVQPFLDHTRETWDRTLATNPTSMFLLGQAAARAMVEQGLGGAIVNMASTNGHMGERGLAAYNASKGVVMLLTKTITIELAEHNIRVNRVSPGWIRTELTQEAGHNPAFVAEE